MRGGRGRRRGERGRRTGRTREEDGERARKVGRGRRTGERMEGGGKHGCSGLALLISHPPSPLRISSPLILPPHPHPSSSSLTTPQVRSTAVGYLQRSVVAAEKLCIGVDQVQQSLMMLVLPMTNDLSRHVAASSKEFPQVRLQSRGRCSCTLPGVNPFTHTEAGNL
jgi:hypothetical protein